MTAVSAELVESLAYKAVIEDRIATLWSYRSWYRTHLWADWSDLRRENEAELRALIRLVRLARRLSAPVVEQQDPLSQYKGMTESESRAMWGDR